MGMPVHEVLAVAEVGGCHVVTTHDGQRTLVTDDGATEPYTQPEPDPAPVADMTDGEGQADGDGVPIDPVPDGYSAKDVLAWVGDDTHRAAAALAAEQARAEPRSTVVSALQKLVAE
jgi:hypothetical protein